MFRWLAVGAGGFIGSVLRFAVGQWLARSHAEPPLPWGTVLVNVSGCFAIGILAALVETRGLWSGTTRAFVFVGILGGFTTFSTFGYETVQLVREGHPVASAASVAVQVVGGIAAVWAGQLLVRALGAAS